MNNLNKFWNKVPKGWRHFTSEMSEEKRNRIIKRVNEHLLSKLNFDSQNIKEVLDWGCGGGLIAKELSKYSNVSTVDISEESLEEAKKYAPRISYQQKVTDDISKFNYKGNKPDLVFSNEVIQHFPSYDYFIKVLNCWTKNLSPKFISIQIKVGEHTNSTKNYDKDFLNGLLLNVDELEISFSERNYNLISKVFDFSANKKQKLGYLIFEKINN